MPSIWKRLRHGLARTRSQFTDRLQGLLHGRALTAEAIDELEELLIGADVGVEAAAGIVESLEDDPRRTSADSGWVIESVRSHLVDILSGHSSALATSDANDTSAKPSTTVVMVVGVNGVGKTTTIGKLAARLGGEGHGVLIGAADTFRAAADEQIDVWAKRAGADIVRDQQGADPASVAYGTVEAARSRGMDYALIDTAGRLHTKSNLMAELVKMKRVIGKLDPAYPHETLLVLDATNGQNALVQAKQFNDALGVTGIALTKLDSSARGGIVIAIAQELDIPIKFVGVGEQVDDLQDFDPESFADALFDIERDEDE